MRTEEKPRGFMRSITVKIRAIGRKTRIRASMTFVKEAITPRILVARQMRLTFQSKQREITVLLEPRIF